MTCLAQNIETVRTALDLEGFSRQLGHRQMEHFVANPDAKPLLPVAWAGGEGGGLLPVTRKPVVHALDLAQMLAVRMGRFDVELFTSLLEGAICACNENTSGRLSGDARIHLERILGGQRFQRTGPMVYARAPYCSHAG